MFSDPEGPIATPDSIKERLLAIGIRAGRATSEREFHAEVGAFHLLWASSVGTPESTGGPSRSLASALNANHD